MFPMLKTCPIARGSASSLTRASTTSPTYVKLRDWVPSPCTVIGCPASACRTKLGITMPYWPLCLGPTVLKKRTMTIGSFFSFQ